MTLGKLFTLIFLRFIYVFMLSISITAVAGDQVWTQHGECSGADCPYRSGKSLFDYCKSFENVVISETDGITVQNFLGPLTSVVYSVVSLDSASDPFDQGWCVFGNQHQFSSYGAIWSGPHKCGSGETFDRGTMSCVEKEDTNKCTVSNPIEIASGNKVQWEIDKVYSSQGQEIPLRRYYISRNSPASVPYDNNFYGGRWRFDFMDELRQIDLEFPSETRVSQVIFIDTASSISTLIFQSDNNGASWENKNGGHEAVSKLVDGNGGFTWLLHYFNGIEKTFDSNGRLIKLKYENGKVIVFEYLNSSKTVKVKTNNQVIFTYFLNGHRDVVRVEDGHQNSIDYNYDFLGNLISVTHQDGSIKKYHYEDSSYKKALTGFTDEKGVRYATWVYDGLGRVILSKHADENEKTLIGYNEDGSTIVTNPLGKKTKFYFDSTIGSRHLVKVEGVATQDCAGANREYTYTSEGWVASKTDWNGNKTTYIYNTKGQEIFRTEASGTSLVKTITTEWHTTLNLKTKVTESDRETVFVYDANGLLTNQSTRLLP